MGALLEAERDCAEVGKKIFAMKNMFWLIKDSWPHKLTSGWPCFHPLTLNPC